MKHIWLVGLLLSIFAGKSLLAQDQIDRQQKNIVIYEKEGMSNLDLLDEYFNIHEIRVDQQIMIVDKGAILYSKNDTTYIEIIPPPDPETLTASTDNIPFIEEPKKDKEIASKKALQKQETKQVKNRKASSKRKVRRIKRRKAKRRHLRKQHKKRKRQLRRKRRNKNACYSF